MKVIEKILMLIKRRKLAQYEVEELVGLSANRISKWANGVGEPSATQALKLARLFDVSLDWLCDEALTCEPIPPSAAALEPWESNLLAQIRILGPKDSQQRLLVPGQVIVLEGRPGPLVEGPIDRADAIPMSLPKRQKKTRHG